MADKKSNLSTCYSIAKALYGLAFSFANIFISVFLLIGATCSIILLYKLFPSTAIPLLSSFLPVFKIILYLILGSLVFACIFFYIFYIGSLVKEQNKQSEQQRKKSISEIVNRLKKEIKE